MTERAAEIVWLCFGAYIALGALVALTVLLGGLRRIDPVAATAPLRVKALIAPGLVVLWPLLVRRLLGGRPREDQS